MKVSARPFTRRTLLKAGLSLGTLVSTGSIFLGRPAGARADNGRGGSSGKNASWHKDFLFQDESLSFELIRTISKATDHGADIGECLATAWRIREKEGEQEAVLRGWHDEWRKLAERIEKIGDECLARGHKISARDAYFRASEYYRSAEFYLHDHPENPALLKMWDRMSSCFEKARRLSIPSFEAVRIPYKGTKLPAYFCAPAGRREPRPTLLIHTGFDGTIQEVYLEYANHALQRGYNCLIFEGPGQGSMIRIQGIPYRYDWEKVVTPVVDYVLKRQTVDPKRIALMGLSMGGYFAPRAAAYEHRLAACIANQGVMDCWGTPERVGVTREEMIKLLEEKPEDYEREYREGVKNHITGYWVMTHGMWAFRAKTLAEFELKLARMNLRDCAHLITCPTLVLDSEAEQFSPGQAKKLFEALTSPKTYMLFKAGEGAELHCQEGGRLLGVQRIFDWLDETFSKIKT